jgi:hypothetical protein
VCASFTNSLAMHQCKQLQCIRKVTVHLSKVLEMMPTCIYTGLNPFNFIRKHFLRICVRKFAVHLSKVLEMMSTIIDTGLNLFNFIRLSAQRLSEQTLLPLQSSYCRDTGRNTVEPGYNVSLNVISSISSYILWYQ